ncbi:MAG TPA: GAF domain-containing sensor histidine kinase, partial [Ignavibacteriaceae bacterium]
RESVKLTEAQAGVLYRVDPVKNLLITEQETENGFVDVSYSFADGLTGLAAETGEIINVREPEKDFRYSEEIDSISGIVGTSLMCVPVKNENGETIAVICLANSSSGKFSISDEEKMSQLVPHISQRLQCLASVNKLLDDNKNIYLSTLTKFITDNIQTPVLTMKYYAGQIKKKSVPQDVRTVLNVLMDQADSVVDFLHSTLAFTENRNTLEIEKCSLKTVLDDTLGLLAEYVESRNVGLYKKVESNINVKLDKKAFYQACHQIAKNACDAMGESGNIYITAKQSGDLVNIEFRDTGPGIPDDIKTQIFQPFKSFKKENATGLGLTIAQRIIRDHGGELTVESNPEQGAIFIISLPVFDEI